MFWQLGACRADVVLVHLCSAAPASGAAACEFCVGMVHPLLLIAMAILTLRIFIFRDGRNLSEDDIWTPFLRVLIPLLGGLLTAAGAVGLAEDGMLRGAPRVERFLRSALSPRELVSTEPCKAASGDLGPAALLLALWLGASAFAVGLMALSRAACWQSGADGHPQDLTKGLLNIDGDKDQDGDGPDGLPRPAFGHVNPRHQQIVDAFYGPDSQDLSHLSEDERKIVEVCREDENERARYQHGGGLW